MDFSKFLKFLKTWIGEINDKNNGLKREDPDFILLDKNYFVYENGAYSIINEAIRKWKNAKILFIADNPGDEEKNNFEYLYYDCNNRDTGYYRRAGYKFYNFTQNLKLSVSEIVKFNKCLISTSQTKNLTIAQLHRTNALVSSFIKEFHEAFPDVLILFSGVNGIRQGKTIFKPLYDKLGNEFLKDSNVGFMGHISRKKFPNEYLNKSGDEKLSLERLIDVSKRYKDELFEKTFDSEDFNADMCVCTDCCFLELCEENDDDDDNQPPDSAVSIIV